MRRAHNAVELLEQWVGLKESDESAAVRQLERIVYKNTECGCWVRCIGDRLTFAGYAEGSDVELPVHELRFPVDPDVFAAELTIADSEGSEEWIRVNRGNYENCN